MLNLGFEKAQVSYQEQYVAPNRGTVTIEPLERGYGHTMGVALRRVMMDSLPGASVIGLQIPNVYHEFMVIPGTATDVTELILQLKKMRFSVSMSSPEVAENTLFTLRFFAREPGLYCAKDLEVPSGIEIQTPDEWLVNVTGEQTVSFELFVRVGRGYVEANKHQEFEQSPDIIKVDGVFSPVKRVGYQIENMRIGQNAQYEKLIMDIETDGSLSPKEAVLMASKILYHSFYVFEEMSEIVKQVEVFQEKKEEGEMRVLDFPIERLDLSARSFNCLKKERMLFVRDIVKLTEKQLFGIKNLGVTSIKEIVEQIEKLGLELQKE